MGDRVQAPIAASIYWMLPGPQGFIDSVSHAIAHSRALVVAARSRAVTGFGYAFERALRASHADMDQPVRLNVDDGSHIESDVGLHMGLATMSPSQLARHASGKRHTIVLAPKTPRAVEKCRQYLMDFAEASRDDLTRGAVTLVVVRADLGASWPKEAGLSQVEFSGALSPEEMKAYVGMRMIGRRGPGSTALTQHLVAEFAGFDAGFAEELMRLDEHDLMELPQSLSLVAHRMPISDATWRESRFDTGSVAEVNGDVQAHVLHEWHLASHEGPMQEAAARSIASRYWRAALHALMPWLEEMRHRIVTILTPALEVYLAPTGGVRRKTSRGDRVIEIAISDLECNDLVQMQLDRQNQLVVFDPYQKAAADICFKVTRVRNDLAHMKCPDPGAIIALVQAMDELLRDTP
jgi:hypothetical protein